MLCERAQLPQPETKRGDRKMNRLIVTADASRVAAFPWSRTSVLVAAGMLSSVAMASAQVELKTYADANGYIDVQKLTCAQLANTFQEDADFLTAWYSGWYNGLGKKHMMKVDRAKTLEHEVIVHCKANPGKKVIQAIDVVFKTYRAEQGIKVR
jgi:hypothetical protein